MIQKKYLAEIIGSLIFSLGINLSTLFTNGSQIPNLFSIIACLFCAITITRNISGGHLNGAVTFGFTYETRDVREFLMYYVSQIVGVSIACFLSWFIYHGHILTFSSSNFDLKGIFWAETISTFVFVYNILIQSNDRFSKNKSISTLLIVVGLFSAVNMTSTLSAGCLNPSLAVGHLLTRMLFIGIDDFEFSQFMMYVIGQFLGSFLAAYLYNNNFKAVVDNRVQVVDNEMLPVKVKVTPGEGVNQASTQ